MPNKQLHKRLRDARLQAGFKRVIDAARDIEISADTIYRAEKGENEPNRTTLRALARRYGLPDHAFIEDDPHLEGSGHRVTIEIELPASLSPEAKIELVGLIRNMTDSIVNIINNSHKNSPN